VLVIEKDEYPRHKVCGEYISMESRPFLERLGLPVRDMQLPVIDQLLVTDVKGKELRAALKPGGFGISRYALDAALAKIFTDAGGVLLTKTKADQVTFESGSFTVHAAQQQFTAKIAAGAWGKRSNMDIKQQRGFILAQKQSLNNYIGIKYHIRYNWPQQQIALHNFENGYCGISNVEEGKTCLCYLTTAANLQRSGNDIQQMERTILMQNPQLEEIFSKAEFLWPQPQVISQISFQRKEQVLDHVLLLGDAAGLITPLCGNGMSMAFHASKLAFEAVNGFLAGRYSRAYMEDAYAAEWKKRFSTRLKAGRMLQANFGKNTTTSLMLGTLRLLPFLQQPLIRATFGKEF
jgi:flavin-dependent dehydrogenase